MTAISRTPNKAEEARKFGAHEVLITEDPEQVKAAKGSLDFILATVSSDGADWNLYLSLLKKRGRLCLVGVPNKVTFHPMLIVGTRISFTGSNLSTNQEAREMLEFCAKHNIVAQVEPLAMTPENADLAMAKIDRNEPRYRVVMVNEKHPNNRK